MPSTAQTMYTYRFNCSYVKLLSWTELTSLCFYFLRLSPDSNMGHCHSHICSFCYFGHHSHSSAQTHHLYTGKGVRCVCVCVCVCVCACACACVCVFL